MAATSSTKPRASKFGLSAALAARVFVASVLLTAGAMKFAGQAQSFGAGGAARMARPDHGLLVLSEAEICLGLALLFGCWPRVVPIVATVVFIAFFGVALHRALSGAASCGCFGQLPVKPWLAALLDALCVVSLVFVSRRADAGFSPHRRAAPLRQLLPAIALSNVALILLGYAGIDVSSRIARAIEVRRAYALGVAKASWADAQIARIAGTELGRPLSSGDWTIVFYSPECASCRQLLPGYIALATELKAVGSSRRVALVDVSPTHDPSDHSAEFARAGTDCLRLALPAGVPLPPALPISVRTNNGETEYPTSLAQELMAVSILRSNDQNLASHPSASALLDYSVLHKQHRSREVACGPLSLIEVLRSLGVRLSPNDEESIIEAAGAAGTNLAQLKELAEEHGLYAYGVSATTTELRRIGLPAVVFVGGTGFAAVTGYSPSGLTIKYPSEPARFVSDAQFAKAFRDRGRALLVSRSELPRSLIAGAPKLAPAQRSQPILRLSQSMMTVGHIHRRKWRAAIEVANDGDAPLLIHRISVSSGRISATIGGRKPSAEDIRIPPGAVQPLIATGEQLGRGSFAERITLFSNDPNGDAAIVPVRGFIEPPVFFPMPIEIIDPWIVGTSVNREIRFEVAAGVPIESLSFVNTAKDAIEIVPRLPTEPADHALGTLLLRPSGAVTPGWHRYTVTAGLDVPDAVTSRLDVVIDAVARLEARPNRAYVRDSEMLADGAWSRRFFVQAAGGLATTRVDARWADPTFERLLELTTREDSRNGTVIAEVHPKPGATANDFFDNTATIFFTTPAGDTCDVLLCFAKRGAAP